MWKRFDERARKIDAATAEDRNRVADFLRVGSISMVVLGHWLVGFITVEDGRWVGARLLAVVPQTQWLTWIFQVMPVFFFVGGLANAISWSSARKKGESYADWVRRRGRRLLWPLVPLFVVWIAVVALLGAAGMPGYLVEVISHTAILPLWFLAAYMCIVAVSPVTFWLHQKLGRAALGIFLVLAVISDLLVAAGHEWVGWANFLWVWGAIHQAGYFWHDNRLPLSSRRGAALAVCGFGLLVLVTQLGIYPLSMVATGEPVRSADSPPSVALMMLAAGQIGLISLVYDRAQRWLHRPRMWAMVMMAGSRMMTIYLWHMSALVLVGSLVYLTGFWQVPTQVDAHWWVMRIPWFFLLAIILTVLVMIFGRFEQPPPPTLTSWKGWPGAMKAIVSVGLFTIGLAFLIRHGLYIGRGPLGANWVALTVMSVGLVGLGVVGRSRGRQQNEA